ncbi:MAG: c-type cytochrome [Candidatus Hydrogenedens sp.]|nr:c-type cytochrome [Candidatus Hydrogenedens sp.]
MREHLARWLALTTGLLLLAAALAFARWQNPLEGAPPATAPAPAPALVSEGSAVYEAQGCALCHAIGGEGDPQHPLDGIGARLSPERIRGFIAPAEAMRASLPAEVFEFKQQFRDLPPEDLDALSAYLSSLR